MPATPKHIHASLRRTLGTWERAADAHDVAVTRAIEDAIRLQESDPDGDSSDAAVLKNLRAALAAQQQDNDETAAGVCPTCGQAMPEKRGGY